MEKYGEAGQATGDNRIGRMRFACQKKPKATENHLECKILIAFPQRQWKRERTSVLTRIACLVNSVLTTRCTHICYLQRDL